MVIVVFGIAALGFLNLAESRFPSLEVGSFDLTLGADERSADELARLLSQPKKVTFTQIHFDGSDTSQSEPSQSLLKAINPSVSADEQFAALKSAYCAQRVLLDGQIAEEFEKIANQEYIRIVVSVPGTDYPEFKLAMSC